MEAATAKSNVIQKNSVFSFRLNPEQFETEASTVAFIDRLYDESKRLKWVYERQWFINLNFLCGRQYIIPNDVTRRFNAPSDPKWRVRHVNNMIRPFVQTKISKLTRQEPQPQVVPSTGDWSDYEKARLAEALIEYWWQTMSLSDMLANALLMWTCVTGSGFLKVCWNPNKGPQMQVDRTTVGDEVFDEVVKAAHRMTGEVDEIHARTVDMQTIDMFLGDVELRAIGPFSLFFHPSAKEVDESLWALESNVKDMDALYEEWGDAALEVTMDGDADTAWNDYEARLLGNDLFSNLNRAPRGDFPKVIEKQFYIRPCRMFPEGKYFVVAGKKVLHEGPFPYDHGQLPYVIFRDNHVPGRIWGQSTIEDAIPIQKAYNSVESKNQEVFNIHASPKWYNPRGSGVLESGLTTGPAEVIEYNHPLRPEQVPPPPLPGYTTELMNRQTSNMENVTGQHEATRGMAPGRVDSGAGISSLQEADDSRLGTTFRHIGAGLAKVARLMLRTAKQFYREERVIQIVGESGIVEAHEFFGDDLLSHGYNDFDVRIFSGSALPSSPSARTSLVMQLAQSGFLSPQNQDDRKLVFRVLELGGPKDAIFRDRTLAVVQARIENADFRRGIMHQPNPWDDHQAHIDEHNAFRRRPEYLEEIKRLPMLDKMIEAHIQMTQALMVTQQAQQAQLAQMGQQMGAQPPQPAPPGPPQPQPGQPPAQG